MSTQQIIDISTRLNEMLDAPEFVPALAVRRVLELEPGIHPDVEMRDYLALDYPGSSGLEMFRRSPKQYQYARSQPPKRTNEMDTGTALHLAVLEPELFTDHYVVLGQCHGLKKDKDRCGYQGSVYRDGYSWCKTHDPRKDEAVDDSVEVLGQADYRDTLGMRDAIHAHERARSLFVGRGQFECSVVFDDPETGVRCKIRPDRLIDRAGMLCDIKTCRSAATWDFPRAAEGLGYFRKLALYRRGLRAVGWPYQSSAIVAIESAAPHDLICYLADEDDLDSADREVTRLLREFRECQESGEWPGYTTGEAGFALLQRPAWAKDAAEKEYDG